jgi:hypothetical protein
VNAAATSDSARPAWAITLAVLSMVSPGNFWQERTNSAAFTATIPMMKIQRLVRAQSFFGLRGGVDVGGALSAIRYV